MTSKPEPVADERLLHAHDLALAALREITPADTIGPPAGHVVEADDVVSLRFHTRLAGYPGWHWTVTIAVVEDSEPTVLEAELLPVRADETLSLGRRSSLEQESRRFADAQGYAVDWDAVGRLDDESLVNGIAQIAPFDAAAKQALLEASDIESRAELIIQLMQFFGRHDGDERVTLQ